MELLNLALIVGLGLLIWFSREYLAKKAQHFATREDFEELLEQQKRTTKEVASIRSNIDHDVWMKQRRWELRRETYGQLLAEFFRQQAMDGIRLSEIKTALTGQVSKEQFAFFQKIRQQQWDSALRHNEAVMTALFLVSPEAAKVINEYLAVSLVLSQKESNQENIAEIIERDQTIKADTFAKLLAIARKEFGEESLSHGIASN